MPELKRNFLKGKMNKDLDERLVPNGEYRNALNIEVNTTDNSNVGALQNIESNAPADNSSGVIGSSAITVGVHSSEEDGKVYSFVKNASDLVVDNTYADYGSINKDRFVGYRSDAILEYDQNLNSVQENQTIVLNDVYEARIIPNAFTGTTITTADLTIKEWIRKGMKVEAIDTSGNNIWGADNDVRVVNEGSWPSSTATVATFTITPVIGFATPFSAANIADGYTLRLTSDKVLDFRAGTTEVDSNIKKSDGSNAYTSAQYTPSGNIITGINVIDNLIYWTDGAGEPKKINIDSCKKGSAGILTLYNIRNHTRLQVEYKGVSRNMGLIQPSDVFVCKVSPKTAPAINASITGRSGLDVCVAGDQDDTSQPLDLSPSGVLVAESGQFNISTSVERQYLSWGVGTILNLKGSTSGITVKARVMSFGASSDGTNTQAVGLLMLDLSTYASTTAAEFFVATAVVEDPIYQENFISFAYRWKFCDGEYSIISPYSPPVFKPGVYSYSPDTGLNEGMVNKTKTIEVKEYLPNYTPRDVVSVEILYRETNSFNVYSVRTISMSDDAWPSELYQANRAFGPNLGSTSFDKEFFGSAIPSNQVDRLQDFVPITAKAQEVSASRLIYGNIELNYDMVNKAGDNISTDLDCMSFTKSNQLGENFDFNLESENTFTATGQLDDNPNTLQFRAGGGANEGTELDPGANFDGSAGKFFYDVPVDGNYSFEAECEVDFYNIMVAELVNANGAAGGQYSMFIRPEIKLQLVKVNSSGVVQSVIETGSILYQNTVGQFGHTIPSSSPPTEGYAPYQLANPYATFKVNSDGEQVLWWHPKKSWNGSSAGSLTFMTNTAGTAAVPGTTSELPKPRWSAQKVKIIQNNIPLTDGELVGVRILVPTAEANANSINGGNNFYYTTSSTTGATLEFKPIGFVNVNGGNGSGVGFPGASGNQGNQTGYTGQSTNHLFKCTSAPQTTAGTSNFNGITSVKSDRTYQIGVVYTDGLSRQSTVMIDKEASVKIPKSRSDNANLLAARARSFAPPWARWFKWFVKETSSKFDNLLLSASFDNNDSINADGSSTFAWLSFNSSDRNKVSIGQEIQGKKYHNANTASNSTITGWKILDISNEVPNDVDGSPILTDSSDAVGKFFVKVNRDATLIAFLGLSSGSPEATFSPNAAVFETKSQSNISLGLYYEVGSAMPIYLDRTNIHSHLSIGSVAGIYAYSGSSLTTVQKAAAKSYIKENNFTVVAFNGASTFSKAQIDSKQGSEAFVEVTFDKPVSYDYNLNSTTGASGMVMSFADIPRARYNQLRFSHHEVGSDKMYFTPFGCAVDEAPINYLINGLEWYNCVAFGNGVESDTIKDDFNAPNIFQYTSAGKQSGFNANVNFEGYGRDHKPNQLIFSQIYNEASGVNGLNQFLIAESITKDISEDHGSIQKLHTRDNDLLTFCEKKVLQIYVEKDELFNAGGNSQLTSTSNVLGRANPMGGEFGIGTNPESFASDEYRVYFVDRPRGSVLRISRDGITEISRYGMDDFFSDTLAACQSVVGSFDGNKDEYNITLHEITAASFSKKVHTLSFNESGNGWTSFKSFVPDQGFTLNNKYYTFRNGTMWQHHVDSFSVKQLGTISTAVGLNKITFAAAGNLASISVGMVVNGSGIKKGTIITSISDRVATISYNGTVQTNKSFTLTSERNNFYGIQYNSSVTPVINDAADSIKSFKAINYEGTQSKVDPSHVDQTTTTVNASTSATLASGGNISYIKAGMVVSGPGIAAGTTVFSIVGTALTLSANATQAATVSLRFSNLDSNYYNLNTEKGWYVESIRTDKQDGQVPEFIEKEGKWFNNISGLPTTFVNEADAAEASSNLDFKESSVQGLGTVSSVVGTTTGSKFDINVTASSSTWTTSGLAIYNTTGVDNNATNTFVILPNPGFSLDAAEFTTLPSTTSYSSVAFTNVGSASTASNTVLATITWNAITLSEDLNLDLSDLITISATPNSFFYDITLVVSAENQNESVIVSNEVISAGQDGTLVDTTSGATITLLTESATTQKYRVSGFAEQFVEKNLFSVNVVAQPNQYYSQDSISAFASTEALDSLQVSSQVIEGDVDGFFSSKKIIFSYNPQDNVFQTDNFTANVVTTPPQVLPTEFRQHEYVFSSAAQIGEVSIINAAALGFPSVLSGTVTTCSAVAISPDTLSLTFPANSTGQTRTSTISIWQNGLDTSESPSDTIIVNQVSGTSKFIKATVNNANDTTHTVPASQQVISYNGADKQTFYCSIITNGSAVTTNAFSFAQSWAQIGAVYAPGLNSTAFSAVITLTPNETGSSRTQNMTVTHSDGSTTATFEITQGSALAGDTVSFCKVDGSAITASDLVFDDAGETKTLHMINKDNNSNSIASTPNISFSYLSDFLDNTGVTVGSVTAHTGTTPFTHKVDVVFPENQNTQERSMEIIAKHQNIIPSSSTISDSIVASQLAGIEHNMYWQLEAAYASDIVLSGSGGSNLNPTSAKFTDDVTSNKIKIVHNDLSTPDDNGIMPLPLFFWRAAGSSDTYQEFLAATDSSPKIGWITTSGTPIVYIGNYYGPNQGMLRFTVDVSVTSPVNGNIELAIFNSNTAIASGTSPNRIIAANAVPSRSVILKR